VGKLLARAAIFTTQMGALDVEDTTDTVVVPRVLKDGRMICDVTDCSLIALV